MVSTRNTSRSHANPSRMKDQPGRVDSRPPGGTLETVQANTDEVEALRLTNQRLVEELEQLTRQMQRPRESRQAQEGLNTTLQEEQPHLGPPREAEAESSQARRHGPHLAPREERNEAIPRGTSEMMSRPLLSKEWGSNHGSIGSKESNRSSAT